jgi:uncharacterized protein (TIGR02598 family)
MLKSIKCERPPRFTAAFALVEITLALGVAAFCLIAVLGLVPVGVQTNRNATSQTAAINILSSVVSDIRSSKPGQSSSTRYNINRTKLSFTTVCFDDQGQFVTIATPRGATCPATHYRFRLDVQIANQPAGVVYPNYVWLKVTWPAAVNPISNPTIKPSGSVETVATYFVSQ